MDNGYIEEVEAKVIDLRNLLTSFEAKLHQQGRSPRTYNHLGTLDANLQALRRVIDRVHKDLD